MARKSKSVYERIADKKEEILKAEEVLAQLKENLQVLYSEKDDLEMRLLLEKMKAKGLNIDEALTAIDGKKK